MILKDMSTTLYSRYLQTRIFFITALLGIASFSVLKSQNTAEKLDTYFSAKARHGDFNGVILVAEKNNILYHKAFGFADFEHKRLNTLHSRFPIGSITKLLTATAALQLVDQGLLNLEAPIRNYLSQFPYPDITLSHLLSHTSGLPGWDAVFKNTIQKHPDAVFTLDDILPEYTDQNIPLSFKPGSAHEYNNVNSVFVALLIEKASGEPYDIYMKQHIFAPAGMNDTFIPEIPFFNYTGSEKKNVSNLYIDHMFSSIKENAETISENKTYWKRFNFKGFGEIVLTAEDLFKFNQALTEGKLLSLSTLKKAQTEVRLSDGSPSGIGLGWQIEEHNILGKLVGHGGGLPGLSTGFIDQPDTQRVVIVFDNTQQNAEDLEMEALMILFGRKLPTPTKNIARIYGKSLLKSGSAIATHELLSLQKDTTKYYLSEQQMNRLGYDFLRSGKIPQAVETFRMNTELFPQSSNTYDSYGESLLKDSQKEKALIMYRKSVELNPANENAKKIILELSR